MSGEFAGECRALRTGPKIKAVDALVSLENDCSRGLGRAFFAPVSQIRRLLWNALPGIGSFQRPSRFFAQTEAVSPVE